MKKWLSPLLFASCLFGAGMGAAEAKYYDAGAKDRNIATTNVDAITTVPLHVRSGPGKYYKSHDILPPDFPLIVGSCTRHWCQVYYSGSRSGWAALPYLAFKEGSRHYNNPNLGPFLNGHMGPRKYRRGHHRWAYSVNGGRAMGYTSINNGVNAISGANGSYNGAQAGWWTNYHRPVYHRPWQPRWWQKK